MRLLFATRREFFPDRVDGAINAVHALLQTLSRRGHVCEAIAPVAQYRPIELLKYRAIRLLSARKLLSWPDERAGYVANRCWPHEIEELIQQRIRLFRPDLLLTQLEGASEIAQVGAAAGIPTLIWIHDTNFSAFIKNLEPHSRVATMSCSEFVAETARKQLGLTCAVLYPPVDLDRCKTSTENADSVTFINPTKSKGLAVAIDVARLLPHRGFLFVESYPLSKPSLDQLSSEISKCPNIAFRRWSRDVKSVYRRTRVLLVPSQWPEAFCMVAVEANANGIPVVASRIGGIPATAGPAGILIEPDAPAEDWASAIEKLLSNDLVYAQAASEARRNAEREEFQKDVVVDAFLEIAGRHIASSR